MNKLELDKKQEILKVIDNIDLNTKELRKSLETIYESPTIDHEKEFVSTCNYMQMLARQAIMLTGYYKALSGIPRPEYAPEELIGDEKPLFDYVTSEMVKIEKQIEDGNSSNPIDAPNTTKEEWLKAMEDHKITYNKIYEESKEYFNKKEDESFSIVPVLTTIILDDDIINAAKGFIVGPVGLFRNKLVECVTQVFDNLHEMKIFLLNVQCKTRDMVLYMTFEQAGKYMWRGVFVNKI